MTETIQAQKGIPLTFEPYLVRLPDYENKEEAYCIYKQGYEMWNHLNPLTMTDFENEVIGNNNSGSLVSFGILQERNVDLGYIGYTGAVLTGIIVFSLRDWTSAYWNISYMVHKDFRNQGIATHAVAQAIEALKKYTLAKYIIGEVYKTDTGIYSAQVLQKNGFIYSGKIPEATHIKGKLTDRDYFIKKIS